MLDGLPFHGAFGERKYGKRLKFQSTVQHIPDSAAKLFPVPVQNSIFPESYSPSANRDHYDRQDDDHQEDNEKDQDLLKVV
jgi:hypothetical protein